MRQHETKAVAPDDLSEAAEQTMLEAIGDTPYPVVVDGDGEVVAVVMIYGPQGLKVAEKVAETMDEGGTMKDNERVIECVGFDPVRVTLDGDTISLTLQNETEADRTYVHLTPAEAREVAEALQKVAETMNGAALQTELTDEKEGEG